MNNLCSKEYIGRRKMVVILINFSFVLYIDS